MAVSPFGKLPLNTGIFLSRISSFMDRGVNYVLTGFKPGYALQAAELNEIQEQQLFYHTLNNRSSNLWKSYDVNSIPYWDGTTPYNPSNISTSVSGSSIAITISAGWYYLLDTVSANSSNSGIGYWINLTTPIFFNITAPPNNNPVRYGFTYTMETINVNSDPALKDESNSLVSGIVVPGADRIKISTLNVTNFNSQTKFSEIFAAKRINSSTYSIFWPYSNYSKQIAATATI